jgi:hypothetical protein
MKTKIIIIALFVTFVLASCASINKVIPEKTTVPMADNFFFVFKDYSCGTIPFNVLDTKNGILVHTPLEETTSTTISLHLSKSEIDEVFQKIMAIDFFSYPSNFAIPDEYLSITETPTSDYELGATNGTETNTVHWTTGGLAKSEYEKANQLWELLMFIQSIIYNHPEYKQLPEPSLMCI